MNVDPSLAWCWHLDIPEVSDMSLLVETVQSEAESWLNCSSYPHCVCRGSVVGPEGVEVSTRCLAVITEVSRLMDVECVFSRLETWESPAETDPRLSEESKIFSLNLLSGSGVSNQPYGACDSSLAALIKMTESLRGLTGSEGLRQEDNDDFDMAYSHLTGRLLTGIHLSVVTRTSPTELLFPPHSTSQPPPTTLPATPSTPRTRLDQMRAV